MEKHPCPRVRSTAFDPEPLLVAIPYLLGYNPADSLVCLALGSGGSVVLTVRTDWREAAAFPDVVAERLITAAAASRAEALMLVAAQVEPPAARVLEELVELAAFDGPPILWTGWTTGDTWSSQSCSRIGCVPHVLPAPSTSDLVLELILEGAAPAATRSEVAAEVAAAPAGDRFAPVDAEDRDLERWRDDAVAAVMQMLVPEPAAGATLPDDAGLALLARACADIRVRDTVLYRVTLRHGARDTWRRLWHVSSTGLRRAPENQVAPLGAVAGLAAWQLGDGLRAGEALTRARLADPEHGLASLLQRALDAGMPPRVWGQIMSGLTEEECRYGRDDAAA